jgi:hypothetical protein
LSLKFQKAAKRNPEVATLDIRFRLDGKSITTSDSMLSLDKVAKKIMDIFRGAFLQTRPRPPLDQLGQLLMEMEIPSRAEVFASWEVFPSSERSAIISEATLGGEVTPWAIDPWSNA